MNQRYQGFILMATLLFITLFSLLSLFAMSTAKLALQSTIAWQRKQTGMITVNKVLQLIENQSLASQSYCTIAPVSPSQWPETSPAWWNQQACHGQWKQVAYDYVIEPLGMNACVVLNKPFEKPSLAAVYYRITLRLPSLHDAHAFIIVQSTVAQAEEQPTPCTDSLHSVVLGRQMQRVLIGESNG